MTIVKAIYSNRCWHNEELRPATVVTENGVIAAIFSHKTPDAIDTGDDILMPGIIDAHVHINEPGRTDWEGFETATKAAAAGGITTIMDMPLNATPVTTTVKAFKEKAAAAKDKLFVNVGFYGGLVPSNIDDLEALMVEGVPGIKCFLFHSGIDEFPNVTEEILNLAMPLITRHRIPLLAHCELYDEDSISDLQAFPNSYFHYLRSRPARWEYKAVELMIRLCRLHRCAVHIVHVSSAETLDLILKAKAEGLPLTAETCPHYLYFNSENIADGNTVFKCAPPIRDAANNLLLKNALGTGVLDFLTTDHSPAPPEIKQIETGNFHSAWGGIAGLQFLLPASWSALKDILSLEEFIPLLTSRPAAFLQLDKRKGRIAVGYDPDLMVWRPEEKMLVQDTGIFHRHKISPYNGEELYGCVKQTIVNGRLIYFNGNIVDKHKPEGKLVFKDDVFSQTGNIK